MTTTPQAPPEAPAPDDREPEPAEDRSPGLAARLLKAAPARAMFDAVLDRALRDKVRKRRVPLAAVDGTGMESWHVSRYYVKRRSKTGTGTQETT